MTVPFEVNFARHRAYIIYYIIFFEKIKVKIQKKEKMFYGTIFTNNTISLHKKLSFMPYKFQKIIA